MTREAPLSRAIWPTWLPTAPAAQEPGVRGEAGHAEDPEVRRQRRGLRVDLDGLLGVHDGVLAPAEEVQHEVAGLDALGVRGDDLADRAALHGLAELEG